MTEYAIAAENLCKCYDGVRAACGVHLEVAPGRLLALLGASGCGKTTVLRMLAGFIEPDRGCIRIGGQTVYDHATNLPPEHRRIGMVFQDYALFPHLSVRDNVAYGLDGREARNRAEEMLERVGLDGTGTRMPHELSGGQQQRVALARALAPAPAALLLDEPFSNLDAALRVRVRTDVRAILRQVGATAIFVTHDQEEAFSIADEVAVMMHGVIVQTGTPADVYRSPIHRDVAAFLGDANFLEGYAEGHQVHCEIGELITVPSFHGKVDVMFRPEDLVLSTYGTPCAVVEDSLFFGHDQLVRLRLPSGTILHSRLLGSPGAFPRGAHVHLRVNSPVMVYPAGPLA